MGNRTERCSLCHGQLKQNNEALADFNRSIALNPSQGIFYQNRSFLYNSLGDRQHALEDIVKARNLGVAADPAYLKFLETK